MDRLVLLITVDSLRVDRVASCRPGAGYERDLTPQIDELAAEGTVCTDAFATGPGTRQSFPGILSSTPPLAYGGYNRLGPERPTVAERFRQAGFNTGGVHSNAQLSSEFGYDRGFDTFVDLSPASGGNEGGDGRSLFGRLRDLVGKYASKQPAVYRELKRIEARLTGINRPYATATRTRKRAVEWLSGRSGDAFLWVHFMDVHVPYYPPKEFREQVWCGDITDTEMADLWLKLNSYPEKVTDSEIATLKKLYDATVRYTDHEVGQLLDAAREATTEEPVVAFTSDHGDEFRDHGGVTHSPQLYDELVHVPLILNIPDRQGRLIESPVSLMDIGPTLLALVDGDGAGLWGEQLTDRRPDDVVFSEVAHSPDHPSDEISRDFRITSCRTSDTTFIRDDLRSRQEAYDRTVDPSEQEPLDEVSDSFRERIDEFRRRVDETSPELLGREMSGSVESRLEDLGYLQR